MDATSSDKESVIGDECHIVAREKNGPRGSSSLPDEERDEYENLILLCRIHHKLVDDQPNTYTLEKLKTIKSTHEAWVRASLRFEQVKNSEFPVTAYRVRSGQQLLNVICHSHAFYFRNDDPKGEDEAFLLGEFAQSIQDYIDIWDSLEAKDRVMIQFEVNTELDRLTKSGFLVFGCQQKQKKKFLDKIDTWLVAYIVVLSTKSRLVQRKEETLEKLAQTDDHVQDQYTNFIFLSHA